MNFRVKKNAKMQFHIVAFVTLIIQTSKQSFYFLNLKI